jgi:propionyl-CoA synthetase
MEDNPRFKAGYLNKFPVIISRWRFKDKTIIFITGRVDDVINVADIGFPQMEEIVASHHSLQVRRNSTMMR